MKLNLIASRKALKQIQPLFDQLDVLKEHCKTADRMDGFVIIENILRKSMKEEPEEWLESLTESGSAEARLLIAVELLSGKQLISGCHDFPSVEGKLYKSGDDLLYLFNYSLDRLVALDNTTAKQKREAIKELEAERNKGFTIDFDMFSELSPKK